MSKWKRKLTVKRSYDGTAKMYDARYREEQEAKYQAALLTVKPTGIILDVGCGTGLLFSHIASTTESVVGIDISKRLLLHAREHSKTLDNVGLIQADADNLPFKDAEFDTVYAFTVLQNMPKPLDALLEFRRIAKEGAMLVVTGLKKTFSIEALEELSRCAELQVVSVKDDERLKCYVAITRK